jgi:thioredoxin-like negative regulator of GroEL
LNRGPGCPPPALAHQPATRRYVVVHFYHEEFITCKVMDKHLRAIAPRMLSAKFLRIDAPKSPFFVAKLKIRTLPSVAMFVDGVLVGKQTGFEGLVSSATDEDFPTARLAR